jgi:glutathione S-transferase
MADLYLVPQCANAARFGIRLDEWPRLATIVDACLDTEAARSTRPEAVRPPR